MGNYFDIGPDPLAIPEILLDHKARRANLSFASNIHERQLAVAAAMVRFETHEKPSWISPYSGTARTIFKLGVNPWELLTLDDSPLQSSLRIEIERRGWTDFVLTARSRKYPYPVGQSAVFGGRMTISDGHGREICGVESYKNYFRDDYVPWMHREISQHAFDGKFSLCFDREVETRGDQTNTQTR